MNKPEKSEKKKENAVGGGLYIALALCILSVICVGVCSAIINIVGDTVSLSSPDDPVTVRETAQQAKAVNDDPVIDPEPLPEKGRDIPVNAEPTETKTPETVQEQPKTEEPASVPEVKSFSRPVGATLCKPFSEQELLYSVTMNDYRTHLGADYRAGVGDAVRCFAAGKVEAIYEDPLMGQTVVIDHGNGLKSVYQNLSTVLPSGLEVGKTVAEGEILGGVGETGLIECEEGAHLHFAVTVNGVPVDPESYFS